MRSRHFLSGLKLADIGGDEKGRFVGDIEINEELDRVDFPIIVKKFGGSTLADDKLQDDILNRIIEDLNSGKYIVIVVSAIGRQGSPYATDTLLGLLPDDQFVCRREKDLLMACGEILSAIRFASRLREKSIPAIARTGFEAGIVTDGEHTRAKILGIDPSPLLNDLRFYRTVVVAGFQGISQTGHITTLGRGGSDTSALAIGAALHAEKVEIYTDQSGVFSADPRIVESAKLLKTIHAEDIRQMAWLGTQILHPRAAELAIRHNLNVTVGTVNDPANSTRMLPETSLEASAMITGIASGNPVDQITVKLPREDQHLAYVRAFEVIADAGISMDMFTITEEIVRFTVPVDLTATASRLLDNQNFSIKIRHNCVKVSIVGAGMHGMRGVMSRFSRCLYEAKIPILQAVDSHATISGLIPGQFCDTAVRALHSEFIEN